MPAFELNRINKGGPGVQMEMSMATMPFHGL